MQKEKSGISCPAFLKQETVIKELTGKINQAKGVREKVLFAEELQKETDVLLTCPDYDDEKLNCTNCRFIANLRKKTAGLIIKLKS